ncbi:haloacid dehalogenase-like hydrolase [Chitinophaga flava]|uniref:HAD-IB family hydrolase n=1 Tax=Chitinophaga flava TaxID=2259036 RepID=A0A365Y5E1_9BACT|nr:haloacid dehalogenase-like hydrolase [Chitinophaga flava]RBL93806.1 hypothetical protein DF182_15025 [Chitinophaga flava]
MRNIAFVDICGTLYDSNTTMDFLSLKNPAFAHYRSNFFVRVMNKISRMIWKRDFVRSRGVAGLKGQSRDGLYKEAEGFVNEYLKGRERNEVHEIVMQLREKGYEIVLISATLDFIAHSIGAGLKADKVYASGLGYNNGICDGLIRNDLLGNKHLVARSILSGSDIVPQVVVITDDKTDLKLAQMANEVYVIAPVTDNAYWKGHLGGKMTLIEKKKTL